VEELHLVGAKLLWNKNKINLHTKYFVLSVYWDDKNMKKKSLRVLK
jgi:hypothetical protein